MLMFSMTLPATRVSAPELGGATVGLGRALIAAVFAGLALWLRREPWPERRHLLSYAWVSFGGIIMFPLLTSLALLSVPSIHAAVIIGFLPAVTAIMAVLRAGERPPLLFWLSCALGCAAIVVFAVDQGAGTLQIADGYLALAMVLVAFSYAEGGKLARELPGWKVISWSLVLSAPVILVVVLFVTDFTPRPVSGAAWLGLGYVSLFSMWLGFICWYRGMGLAGVARVGQLQLAQPVVTLVWSVLLLGETLDGPSALVAALVIGCAAFSQWASRRMPSR